MRISRWNSPLAVLMAALILASCGGEDEKRANKAAAWLQDTAAMRDLPEGWVIEKVTVQNGDGVEMEVHLTSPEQENNIRTIPQMQRFAAVQVACPKKDDEIWTMLSEGQKLWLSLIGASGDRLTRGTCWRR